MSTISEIQIPMEGTSLGGRLRIPEHPRGLVIFAHGSGSSRFSRRNNFVAESLHSEGLATLLFDLLTPDEEVLDEQTRQLRFNIPLLAGRLEIATSWIKAQNPFKDIPIAYFGASTGAAAAIIAAAKLGADVQAVVSRGGRPDLAGDALRYIKVPVLLIVGGSDDVVLDLNKAAMQFMTQALSELAVIPGATHLFEEPGTLEKVAQIAGHWLVKHLSEAKSPA